jgi:hypothetical protein
VRFGHVIVIIARLCCGYSMAIQRCCWHVREVTSMWLDGLSRRPAAIRDPRLMRCYDRGDVA